jgi:hypothetical protein
MISFFILLYKNIILVYFIKEEAEIIKLFILIEGYCLFLYFKGILIDLPFSFILFLLKLFNHLKNNILNNIFILFI